MNTLEEKHFEVVTDLLMGLTAQKVAKECTSITIDAIKGFDDWMKKERYEPYEGRDIGNIGKFVLSYTIPPRSYLTIGQLLTTYIDSIK